MRYRAEIDGLRAIAVGSVILFHTGIATLRGGFVGVDVFFVISGYLITSIIVAELEIQDFSLLRFYERRARRILPALFLVMAACLPFAWLWLMPSHMQKFSLSLASVSLFSSNIQFWRESGYFDNATETKPLLHTWSLAVEEQYYILFPLFLMLMQRMGKRRLVWWLIVIAVSSLALAQLGLYYKPEAAFYLLPTRGWELLVGSLTAFYLGEKYDHENRKPLKQVASLLGISLILYSVFAFNKTTPFPGLHALVPTLGTALVIVFATEGTIVHSLLSNRVLVGVGLISYSLYLWHQPLFVFAKYHSLTEPTESMLTLLCLLSIGLAYLSWRFVEQPFRRKELFGRSVVFSLAILVGATFVVLGVTGYVVNGVPSRFPQTVLSLAESAADKNPSQDKCMSDKNRYLSPVSSCAIGNSEHIVGLLWGDSHSDALAVALGDALNRQEVGMKHMWYASCPPVLGLYHMRDPDRQCARYSKEVLDYIRADDSIRTIVVAARWTQYLEGTSFDNGEGGAENDVVPDVDGIEFKGDAGSSARRKETVRRHYIDGIRELVATGKNIVLIYPIPEVGWDAPSYAAKRLWFSKSNSPLSTAYAIYKERNADAVKTLDQIGKYSNLKRFYPDRVLCNTFVEARCVVTMNGRALYYDDNHLSNYGAAIVVRDIVKELQWQKLSLKQ